jgi:hypothetical protein
VTDQRRGDDRREVYRAALEHEHRSVLRQMNVIRVIGVAGWLALALAFGVGRAQPQWRAPLPVIAAYLAVAVVLLVVGARSAGGSRLGRYAVGVVDLPLVFLAMDRGIPFYPDRKEVGTPLLVSQATRDGAGSAFRWAPAAPMLVKGKPQPVLTFVPRASDAPPAGS